MITHADGTNGEGCEMYGQRLLNPIHVFFLPNVFHSCCQICRLCWRVKAMGGHSVLAVTVMALTAAALWCSTL